MKIYIPKKAWGRAAPDAAKRAKMAAPKAVKPGTKPRAFGRILRGRKTP